MLWKTKICSVFKIERQVKNHMISPIGRISAMEGRMKFWLLGRHLGAPFGHLLLWRREKMR
jgi:hypothetical protein